MSGPSLPAGNRGFSLIEALVGMVVGAIVLAGAYSLWLTHQQESYLIGKKIDAHNELTLASKRLQRSVTLAGLGLGGAANLAKDDAIGSDTLIIYLNTEEKRTTLASDAVNTSTAIQVDDPAGFTTAQYVAVTYAGNGELRRIVSVTGTTILMDTSFAGNYPVTGTMVYPAVRERYYTEQDSAYFIRELEGSLQVVASSVKNFQVSFLDQDGAATDTPLEVRTVRFSLTGIYPAKEGALNSMVLSSTAIPRNML